MPGRSTPGGPELPVRGARLRVGAAREDAVPGRAVVIVLVGDVAGVGLEELEHVLDVAGIVGPLRTAALVPHAPLGHGKLLAVGARLLQPLADALRPAVIGAVEERGPALGAAEVGAAVVVMHAPEVGVGVPRVGVENIDL